MPLTPGHHEHPGTDSGFTLVEVLVAMVIITVVALSATMAVGSGSRNTNRVKIVDRQHSIVDSVLSRATTNTAWISQYNCGVGHCTAAEDAYVKANSLLVKEPDGTIQHDVDFIVEGVDFPDDGASVGDGEVDVFRITVRDQVTAPPAIGTFRPVVVSGSIDMSVRANLGKLVLRSCEATPQIDQRLAVGMCTKGASETYPLRPPTKCPGGPAWECGPWASAPAMYKRTTVRPLANVKFTLEGPLPHNEGDTRSATTDGQGVWSAADLEPGQYKLTTSGMANKTWWQSHSVPSGGFVTVTAGETEVSTQLFRATFPGDKSIKIHVDTLDITDPANHVLVPHAKLHQAIRILPVPSGRVPFPTGTNMGWSVIRKGDKHVDVVGATSGLYSNQVLYFPGDSSKPLYGSPAPSYVWIDEHGNTAPNPLRLRQEFCDPVERLIILKKRCELAFPGLKLRHCIAGGVIYEPCNNGDSELQDADLSGTPGA